MKVRRSILSVPGHIEKMHKKAAESNVDCIMFDLEDSVPYDKKSLALEQVTESIYELNTDKQIYVRVNHPNTELCYQEIIELMEEAGGKFDGIVLPKTDEVADVHFADKLLSALEFQHKIEKKVFIDISIESPLAVTKIMDIASASDRIAAIVFGIADYQSALGARLVSISGHGENEENIYPGYRWNYVISQITNAAKALELLAIDAPYGNFKDEQGLINACQISAALGMDGKWAIHPAQIDTINTLYAPSNAEIANAQRIVEAYEEANRQGQGAAQLEGRMIDHATYRLANSTVEKAKEFNLIKKS